jgi:hypothetical protein
MRNGVVQCLKPQFGGQLCGETYNLSPEYVQFGKGTDMRHRVELVVLYNLGGTIVHFKHSGSPHWSSSNINR